LVAPLAHWTSAPGASTEQVQRLAEVGPPGLPPEYFDLLRKTNGGEGELAVPPGWVQLFDISLATQMWNDQFYRREYPDFYFFASNGGMESFVITLNGPRAGEVLAIDAIAGKESTTLVAHSFVEFTQHIGKRVPGDA
jgi:hypothetical protein